MRAIAQRLGRDASTISRELRRNASTRTYDVEYKASTAQWHVDDFRRAMMAQVETRSHLRKLARYPLLCALLCALNRHRRSTLPTNRMELYEVALQLLLEQLDTERKIDAVPGLCRREKLLLLGDLAYWLIRNGYSETDRERVIDQFGQSLRTMSHVKSDGYGVYLHLLERSGLLREPVADRVDFVHRTFQEYLAASAAINADDVGTLVATRTPTSGTESLSWRSGTRPVDSAWS